jgi:hypothetical protein
MLFQRARRGKKFFLLLSFRLPRRVGRAEKDFLIQQRATISREKQLKMENPNSGAHSMGVARQKLVTKMCTKAICFDDFISIVQLSAPMCVYYRAVRKEIRHLRVEIEK